MEVNDMKTLLLLAKVFETMEFSVFVDILGWARNDYGYDVQVETCGFKKAVISTFNIPISVNKLIDDTDIIYNLIKMNNIVM
jgi:4-methyl-5(b-hydroxyethyl)-thiazole monophosphate biosynthesis